MSPSVVAIDSLTPDELKALLRGAWLEVDSLRDELETARAPIPILLWCPACRGRHIDEGEFATKVHHTHSCQHCGLTWRPAVVATVGVRFLPGFKNADSTSLGDLTKIESADPSVSRPTDCGPRCENGGGQ